MVNQSLQQENPYLKATHNPSWIYSKNQRLPFFESVVKKILNLGWRFLDGWL